MTVNKKISLFFEKTAAVCKRFRQRPFSQRLFFVIIALIFAARAFLILTFPLDAVTARPASTVVTDRNGKYMRGFLSPAGEWRLPIPISEMGEIMPRAVVQLEDRRFRLHGGIDLFALLRASYQNAVHGRVVSGASTITSQTIRLSFDRPRTPAAKIVEFIQAVALEFFLDKEQILETYLNNVPFGGNIRGVEAAARLWFGKPARELSLAEAALLSGVLRGPAYYRPDRHPERAAKLRDRIIDTLCERGLVSEEEAGRARKEPLPGSRFTADGSGVQTASAALRFGGGSSAADRYGRFRSTIDAGLQNMVVSELKRRLNPDSGITACAILIENETGSVRAYVGNAREGSGSDTAWVDCAQSVRSPGSALKPFIYALAFDMGKLSPASMLSDVPDDGGGDGVRNFDRLYRGPVSARYALTESLNAPAVEVFRMSGAENVLAFLRALGFSRLTRSASYYGESLALGGCGVTPAETARAYSALARGGNLPRLKWNEESRQEEGVQTMSPAAAFLTLDILKGVRNNLRAFADAEADGKRIALKTGTSYGLRDAWCAALTKKYTLVVWFGDPRGTQHRTLVGLKVAAPAAAAVMLRITEKNEPWFEAPSNVVKKELCPLSGAPRNQYCSGVRRDYVIEGVTDNTPCTMHKYSGGRAVTAWTEKLERWRASRGGKEYAKLEITSPKNGALYIKRKGAEMLPLSSSGGQGEIFWFADGVLIEKNGSETPSWRMTAGKHVIAAADSFGNSAEAGITVKDPARGAAESLPLLEEEPR